MESIWMGNVYLFDCLYWPNLFIWNIRWEQSPNKYCGLIPASPSRCKTCWATQSSILEASQPPSCRRWAPSSTSAPSTSSSAPRPSGPTPPRSSSSSSPSPTWSTPAWSCPRQPPVCFTFGTFHENKDFASLIRNFLKNHEKWYRPCQSCNFYWLLLL